MPLRTLGYSPVSARFGDFSARFGDISAPFLAGFRPVLRAFPNPPLLARVPEVYSHIPAISHRFGKKAEV